MKTKNLFFTVLMLIISISCTNKKVTVPQAYGTCPNEYQLNWHKLQYYAFIHFNMNTFKNLEWGYGDASPNDFNPTELDCNQWVSVCKKAGMKGIILTAKHHDGFCLWPTKTTNYSVASSSWRNGKGDIVRELADACKAQNMKFGIYLSPWDRHQGTYGTPEYLALFRAQLKELTTQYGELFEVWFDGANGGDGYYGGAKEKRTVDKKSYYDWENTRKIVRQNQPQAMMFSDEGPDIRWCGDEDGWVGKTNWCTLNRDNIWPGISQNKEQQLGDEGANYWVPAEVDVSIRPGWFYHTYEDSKVKPWTKLIDIYYTSIGRNGNLLINIPVDKRGLIHEIDKEQLLKFAENIANEFKENLAPKAIVKATNSRAGASMFAPENVIDNNQETYWATDDDVKKASIVFEFDQPTTINRILIQEYIRLGQRVKKFTVEAFLNNKWEQLANETTIGYKRILRLRTIKTKQIRLSITDSKACPLISNVALYNAPKIVVPPQIQRNKEGIVTLTPVDKETKLYYTTDGSVPNNLSTLYVKPTFVGKCEFSVIAYDESTQKSSSVKKEQFDLSKKKWKIVGIDKKINNAAFDGNPNSTWVTEKTNDVLIDLGEIVSLKGFSYLPDQSRDLEGIVTSYELFTSVDKKKWKKTSAGEFSNIENNPMKQLKFFTKRPTRYIKFKAIHKLNQSKSIGIAEFDIITD